MQKFDSIAFNVFNNTFLNIYIMLSIFHLSHIFKNVHGLIP